MTNIPSYLYYQNYMTRILQLITMNALNGSAKSTSICKLILYPKITTRSGAKSHIVLLARENLYIPKHGYVFSL